MAHAIPSRFTLRLCAGAVACAAFLPVAAAQSADMATTRVDFVTELTLNTYPPASFTDCYGKLSSTPFTLLFKDVARSASYGPSVCLGIMGGYINGKSDATFGPDEAIPFGEAAEMISKAYGLKTFPAPFGRPSYEPYVMILAKNGAIPTTIKGPWHNVTVGEAQEMMNRVANGVTNRSSVSEAEAAKWMK